MEDNKINKYGTPIIREDDGDMYGEIRVCFDLPIYIKDYDENRNYSVNDIWKNMLLMDRVNIGEYVLNNINKNDVHIYGRSNDCY